MKKKTSNPKNDDLRPEYTRKDLKGAVRGKYFKEFQKGTNIALLAPEIRAAFPNDEAVNEALRSMLRKRSA